MKLRNKKTGITGCIEYVMRTIDPITGEPLLTVRYKDDSGITCYKDYATIKFFNADWEDYNPTEPLIKDEKIRKSIRVWAEAEPTIKEVAVMCHLVWGENMTEIAKSDNASLRIVFPGDLGIKMGKYTITELCGEEEK